MNRVLKLSIVTAISSFLLVGCNSGPDTSHMSSTEMHAAESHKHLSQKKLSVIIKTAGEEAGWKMTEFKSDTFVAEKQDGDETISATVKFNKDTVEVSPENDDLKDAIDEALSK